jgi:hypothetical protein
MELRVVRIVASARGFAPGCVALVNALNKYAPQAPIVLLEANRTFGSAATSICSASTAAPLSAPRMGVKARRVCLPQLLLQCGPSPPSQVQGQDQGRAVYVIRKGMRGTFLGQANADEVWADLRRARDADAGGRASGSGGAAGGEAGEGAGAGGVAPSDAEEDGGVAPEGGGSAPEEGVECEEQKLEPQDEKEDDVEDDDVEEEAGRGCGAPGTVRDERRASDDDEKA